MRQILFPNIVIFLASQASTQDSVKAIATEKPSKSMLEPESPTSEEDEESIDIPKIVGFPPTKIDEDRVKNIDDNQVESETIFAKALKVGGGLTKRDVHSTSPDTDPFAFSERDKQGIESFEIFLSSGLILLDCTIFREKDLSYC